MTQNNNNNNNNKYSNKAHRVGNAPCSVYQGSFSYSNSDTRGSYTSYTQRKFTKSFVSNLSRNDQNKKTRWGLPPPNIDWSRCNLIHFQKNCYVEHPNVSSLTDEQVKNIRKLNNITVVNGISVPNPISSFDESAFPEYILKTLRELGFSKPTPIQIQAWPVALSGRDMIGIAETGSGKTLAFLLPSIIHINSQPLLRQDDGPIVLILAPTRELVEQIKEEAARFGMSSRIKYAVAYGGVPRYPQIQSLRCGAEILIACPGRLIDFLDGNIINLERVTYLVLDEADRMLDMGFEPQIRNIVSRIRRDRQTLMWSATWPKDVQALARYLFSEDPVHISIGCSELKACHNITQYVEVIGDFDKKSRLRSLLSTIANKSKILIFAETKKAVDDLTEELRFDGWPALSIHGDKRQDERLRVLSEFKKKSSAIMVATDVASRGLDVKDVKYVINYDFPNQIEDYIHRIGRTGRAGSYGCAYTFFSPEKFKLAKYLVELLQEAGQNIPSKLLDIAQNDNFFPTKFVPTRNLNYLRYP